MLPLLGTRHVRGKDRKLTRRQLLVRAAVASGALTFAGALVKFASYLKHDPANGRQVLTAREEVILRAVLLAMFPGAHGMPIADVDTIVPKIDDHLAHSDPDARLLTRSVLHVIEEQAIVFQGGRFTNLDAETQAAVIREWELTSVYVKKLAFRSLKLLCGMMYAEQPEARAAMGWYLGCAPAHLSHLGKSAVGV